MQSIKLAFVALAALGLILPQPMAALGAQSQAPIPDLALGQGNTLAGQVVDSEGNSLSDVVVTVLSGDREVVRTKTNKEGRFAVAGLSGGAYTLVAEGSKLPCRVWSEGTAPPNAKDGLLLVSGDTVARANLQDFVGSDKCVYLIGGGALLAIIITSLSDNPKRDYPPTS